MNCLHSFHFLIRWLWVAFFLSAPSQFARATFTEDRLSPEACIFTQQQNANTAALTNAAGAIVERVVYSPYGGIRYRQSNYDTPFLYGGFFGVLTDSNGLIAMRARYYNPLLMRFLTGDPARDGLNWYAYAGGNPLAFADPSGFGPANVLDAVQLGLTVLGFVPGGIGTVANLVNAGISLARDDPGAALGHLAAAVPGLGGILAESRAVINTVRSAAQIEQVFVRAEAAVVSGVARGASGYAPNAGGVIRQFTQPADQVYYRVFSDKPVGSFLTAVPPRSSAWAQEALALPRANTATSIQEVLVPAGTNLQRSRAIPQPDWGRFRGGAEQFELLDRIPTANFGPGSPLP